VVNGDSLALPFRNGCADLVISNGVIHHTPDARQAFHGLARMVRPGGALVVSVYDRRGWYHLAWRGPGALVRALRRVVGDTGLRITVFPLFHLGLLTLLPLATRRRRLVPVATSWNLFHDQFTTPRATFHSAEEVAAWARESGLVVEEQRREAARQLVTTGCRRPAPA
jgi:SAM-dependent methyltransferase